MNGTFHETEVSGCMNKRRLRIIKYMAIAVVVMALAWGASTIAVYAVSSGCVFRRSPKFLGPRETLPPPVEEGDVLNPPENREPTPGTVAEDPLVINLLWWLKAHQQKNGSWNDGPCPVVSTSLAVCAMLSRGEYPYCLSPYEKDFRDMFILAAEYLSGCVSVTNGVVHVLGSDQDERALPLVTKALCDIYGMTRNPNFKEHAAACLRQLAIDTRALLASGAWSGKEEVLLWSAEALTAGKRNGCNEDLSREDINKLCGEISEATVGMNDNGYHGGIKRFRAWMKRGATAKDYVAYRDWMKSKKASFIKSCKEELPAVADTKGVLHRKFFLSESIDAKPSGLGVSADSALGVMELMIGGGGMRNLPIIEESSDNAQPTNEDESVWVEI